MCLGLNFKGVNIEQPTVFSHRGNTLYVGGSGPGNYTNIQDAINDANDGDTIIVFNGEYFEFIVVDKSINLIGENRNFTIIIGYVAFTLSIVADWVNMSGFTIRNGRSSGEGVRIDSNHNNIFNNIIETPNDNVRIFGEYNTITDNIIKGDTLILSGDSNTISDNTISNIYHGIYITDASDNIISYNIFSNSGLFISGNEVWNNIVINNMMNGKPLVYLYGESDLLLDVDAGQIVLVNCTNIIVQNQEIFNTTAGILLWESNKCRISDSTLEKNHYGIYINGWGNIVNKNTIASNTYEGIRLFGDSNIISNNIITNNDDGIYLTHSNHNNINNNTITTNKYYGLLLDYGSDLNNIINNIFKSNDGGIRISSNNNVISDNIITNNKEGIYLSEYNNTISDNTISNNKLGISLSSNSENNKIYHNNFIENEENAYGDGYNNWDDGKYGNFWSDYKQRYPNAKQKLFKPWMWNTPYEIDGGENKDNCPLTNEWPNPRFRSSTSNKSTISQYLFNIIEFFSIFQRILKFLAYN
jgi:parallel beta-helix repeat protein